jgi:hypothetical protein
LVKLHPDHVKGLILLVDIYINNIKELDAAENVSLMIHASNFVAMFLPKGHSPHSNSSRYSVIWSQPFPVLHKVKVKVKLSLCLIKHYSMTMYGGVDT